MNDYISEITLDLNCEKNCSAVYLTQFDKGKKLHLTVTADGQPYSLTGCDVVMKGVLSDGSRIAIDCTVESDGTAVVVTDDIDFPVKGIAAARFVISDSEKTYYTQKLLVYVDDAFDTDVEPEEKYSILDRLIRQVQLIDEHGGIIVDDEISSSSIHPVQNRVIRNELRKYCLIDTMTRQPSYSECDPKTIYTGAKIGNESGVIFPLRGKDVQLFLGVGGDMKVRYYNGGVDYMDWEDNLSELAANKKRAFSGYESSDTFYPTIKAVVDYLNANYLGIRYAEDIRYKLEEFGDEAPDPEDEEYPSALAVWNYVNGAFNKVYSEHGSKISALEAYLGYTSDDILGLRADFENKQFTRLAGAFRKTAGSDFDAFPMFGGRRRCCVANDGTINAYYGEQGYAEDGTNGQVMVYQPKFYYRMLPLKLEKMASGIGYHIRKANYYITANPHPGFKLHPLFYDANGNEVDYVLLSAYEGSMYDVSASAYVNDSVDSITYESGDLLCSVAGKKPIGGRRSNSSFRPQLETLANNLGSGWHLNTIKAESANQLLMMIELGNLNTQTAIGQGISTCPNNGLYNCSSYTGATASLGNATGMATETTYESAGTETVNTTNGKLSVTYRGVENPWGNIWKHANGVNLWGDGHMGGGQVFICDDFSFNESKHDGNYKSAGFTISNDDGYVSAFGYGDEDYDWLFMPSETTGNNSIPVGDYFWSISNLNGYCTARLGGRWSNGDKAGGFGWDCDNTLGDRSNNVGGRLLYVPTANA